MSTASNVVDYETRERWLEARKNGVGASESAALFGVSPWDNVVSLWAKKMGIGAAEDDESRARSKLLKWGARLEPTIAAGYEEDSGRKLWRASAHAIAVHPEIPFMTATPDYFITDAPDRRGRGLAEIKNVVVWRAQDWDDGPPPHIQIQAQHQMAVTGYDYVAVVPLIGGSDDRPIDLERNPEFIAELEAQVRWFWGLVETGVQPPLDGSERTLATIKRLHPADDGTEVVLPPESLEWWTQLESSKAHAKAAGEGKTEAEVLLKAAIGAATYGVLPDGRRLSLKTTARDGYAVEPTTYRTLRIEKAWTPGKKRRR